MKKITLGLLVLAIVALSGVSVLAQKGKARDLFIEKEQNPSQGQSGAKVRILLKRGTEAERYVAPTETFFSGDKIKLAFDINFSGYLALLNVGSSGKVGLLFPYVGADSKIEKNEKEQLIPSRPNDWIKFDNQAGTEQITIIFSTNPIPQVQQVMTLTGQPATVSGNVTVNANSGSTISIAGNIEAQTILQELNSRSLSRSTSRDLTIETVSNATYCVVSPTMISEPTAFVISLKHR